MIARRRQRVFQVVWGFDEFGGMEHHVAELALAQKEHGADVQVFSEERVLDSNAYVRRLRDGGVPVSGGGRFAGVVDTLGRMPLGPVREAAGQALRAVRWVRGGVSDMDLIARRNFHPVTIDLFTRLDEAVQQGRPDVIHVHGSRLGQAWALSWAAARGIPTVYTEHVTLDEWGGPRDADAVAVVQRDAGALACVSQRSRASLLAHVGDALPISVVRHVVNPVVPDRMAPADGPLLLLCAARLKPYKGIDVLLHAMARVRTAGHDVKLTIAGDGPERGRLEGLAASLALRNVTFLGAVAPDRIAQLMQAAHLVVLPSRGEGLPVALVEAMACARGVIATRSGGNAEAIVDGVTGVLVDPERTDQLGDAISSLAANRAHVQRMGVAARGAWKDGGWSVDAVLGETSRLYEQAVARTVRQTRSREKARASFGLRSVVFVTWSLTGDGPIERHLVQLGRGLVSRGIAVTVVVPSLRWPPRLVRERFKQAGITLQAGGAFDRLMALGRSVRRHLVRHPDTQGQPLSSVLNAGLDVTRLLEPSLRGTRPDLIHVHGWRLGFANSATWLRNLGMPVVYTEHATGDEWAASPVTTDSYIEGARAAAAVLVAAPGAGPHVQACIDRPTRDVGLAIPPAPPPYAAQQRTQVVAVSPGPELHTWCEQAFAQVGERADLDLRIVDDSARWEAPVGADAMALIDASVPEARALAMRCIDRGMTLLVTGSPAGFPLSHRGNAMFVDRARPETLVDAILELAGDTLLAQALAKAARRLVTPRAMDRHMLVADVLDSYVTVLATRRAEAP